MTALCSKIQYNNFEPGEFVDIQERTYQQTIELIATYPWAQQREKLQISPTNPSITIEGKNEDFLKLAVYFTGKYVLYYFDKDNNLYKKSFFVIEEAFEYIRNFFLQPVFDISGFKKESTWFADNRKHVITQDFRYTVTPASLKSYIIKRWKPSFIIFFIMFVIFLIGGTEVKNITMAFFAVTFLLFVMSSGVNLFFIMIYHNYCKNKIIIMSKGNDIFYFGDNKNINSYNKNEILRVDVKQVRNSKDITSQLAVVIIIMKSGEKIKIPNLLIHEEMLINKLYKCDIQYINSYPCL